MSSKRNRYLMLTIGVFLTAIGINTFYTPNEMVAGGVSGLGIIIKYYSGKYLGCAIPVSVTNIALNLPLFVLCSIRFGKGYIRRSIAAVFMLSIALEITLLIPSYVGDIMLAAIFGGILTGTGIGFVLNASATTGGTEAAAHLMHSVSDRLSVSDWIFIIDSAVILLGLLVFGVEKAMFAIISVFIASKCVERITSGSTLEKGAMIISEQTSEISMRLTELDCGKITALSTACLCRNTYPHTLFCVFSQNEITMLKETVKTLDSSAFIILFDINDIFGKGYKKL